LVEFSTGGVLWKTKTQPKQPKTMTGVGEPRGGLPATGPVSFILSNQSAVASPALSLLLASTSKTKNLYLEIYPKKVRPGTLTEDLPPFKTKNKKTNNPKCQRKNEQSRRETEKSRTPNQPHTHRHNLLLLLRHGSHFHSSQWPKEDEEKEKEKKRREGMIENCLQHTNEQQ
jgi:hypothetical protein